MLQNLVTLLTKPGLHRYHKPIFLLSHMRANTSLFGHILGSNPKIVGYYEMHIGYYSWKSWIRQKLLYYKDHPLEPETRFIFDKVLHDFHEVDINLLNRAQAKVLFSVREPEQTIKSIVSQFRRERPGHEYCNADNAAHYYIGRLGSLIDMAAECDEYFFYDADTIRENSDAILDSISQWLGLQTPLSKEFDNFHYSGKNDAGDLSGNLEKKKIVREKTDYSDIDLDQRLLSAAEGRYQEASKMLASKSVNKSI